MFDRRWRPVFGERLVPGFFYFSVLFLTRLVAATLHTSSEREVGRGDDLRRHAVKQEKEVWE